MSAPTLSVILPVHNGERYLQEAVESVLNQTFTDFEFIIIDDGSTDKTWEILIEYTGRDQRIALVQNQENIGLTKSLNKGLSLARGKYIARQDADDVSLPERLERQVDFLDEHPEVILVSSHYKIIDPEGCFLGHSQQAIDPDLVSWYMLFYNYVEGFVMFRRAPVMDLGGYREMSLHVEDYDLWLRLSKVGEIAILPKLLMKYRRHNAQITVVEREEQEAFASDLVRKTISELLGEELNREAARELRGFWIYRFPDTRRIDFLHSKLEEIYKAFLVRRQERASFDPNLPSKLRVIVGKQFFEWGATLIKTFSLLSTTRVLVHAFRWSPMGALTWCLKASYRVPVSLLRALFIQKRSGEITSERSS
jgi:glycosyltransferase involved in cell wall biosynthesis